MSGYKRQAAALGWVTALLGLVTCAPAEAGTVSPLPPSDYGVHAVCRPPGPGRAGCLALTLVPRTPQARARTHPLGITRTSGSSAPSPLEGSYGLRPADIHSAYQLPTGAVSAQTIAIVDAYNDPSAESDLKAYDEEFGLPACTAGNGCLQQVNESGAASPLPFPKSGAELEAARKGSTTERGEAEEATGWDLEISLDVETAHAVCQSCHVLLVEAESSGFQDLESAEQAAGARGATEISNSWGGPEAGETPQQESASAFKQPGIVITASAGDAGYLDWGAESAAERGYAEFPASSPHVVAVGGTRLSLGAGSGWSGEAVWNGNGAGGGGCSVEFTAQPWQQAVPDWASVGCTDKRAVADVSADADPYTGLAVHDTSPICEYRYEEAKVLHVAHWCTIGGTSLASPLIASVFALAGGSGGVPYPARTLYQNRAAQPTVLHDVTAGSNGECLQPFSEETGLSGCSAAEEAASSCASQLICEAGVGYDGPSGLGTPNGIAAFQPPKEGAGETGEGSAEAERTGTGSGGSGGSGGTGGGSTGTGGQSGSGAPAPATGAGTAGPSGATGAGSSPSAGAAAAVRLTNLTLTLKALLALNRTHPRISQVGFAFTSNANARVRVTLARRVRRGRHTLWSALSRAVTIAAVSGHNSRHLAGHRVLAPGVYRLTLTPVGGSARSIAFQIG